MLVSELDYQLPKELIAKYPVKERPHARMMQVNQSTGNFFHHHFYDLPQFLKKGDVLVLNDSKVIPSRLFGTKPTGGKVEALLLKKEDPYHWKALLKPGGRVKEGSVLKFAQNGSALEAEVLNASGSENPERLLRFLNPLSEEDLWKIGHMPIPPYFDREDEESDKEDYQTVFAKHSGSVASPTAGLHFNQELLSKLEAMEVRVVYVTLHVGLGTFQPIDSEQIENHKMHEERYDITPAAAEEINSALKENRRVIACGTTSARVLESAFINGKVDTGISSTRLLIYPPYSFKVISGLITNFHLPKTTLLFLVGALIGTKNLLNTYQEAIREKYRFFSYGDGMLIL